MSEVGSLSDMTDDERDAMVSDLIGSDDLSGLEHPEAFEELRAVIRHAEETLQALGGKGQGTVAGNIQLMTFFGYMHGMATLSLISMKEKSPLLHEAMKMLFEEGAKFGKRHALLNDYLERHLKGTIQ